MKHIPLLALAAFTLAIPAAHAQVPNLVTPGDTFSYDVFGYDSTTGNGFYLTSNIEATFGTTTTFTGDGFDGQDITVSSFETIGATTTTDTFIISTPTSFVQEDSIGGITISALEFDIGNDFSGSDPVNVLTPITSYTATGTALYSTNSTLTLAPQTTLDNGGRAYEAYEGISSGAKPIDNFNVRRFTYAITYANAPVAAAPEPSQYAAFAVGLLGLGALALKAKRRTA